MTLITHPTSDTHTNQFARDSQERYSIPRFIRPAALSLRQWLQSCRGENVNTVAKKQLLKEQYYELLDILQGILENQPFLFGNHPTLIDFGFAGPFFRHFSSDFTPRKVMQQRAPAVYQWVAVLWNSKGSRMPDQAGFPPPSTLPGNWHRLLQLLPEYLEYYHLNTKAFSDNQSQFVWNYRGELFTVPVVPYRAWCRQKLQLAFKELDAASKEKVEVLLRKYDCWELFWRDGTIFVPPELGTEPPFSVYPAPKERSIHIYKWDFRPIFNRYLAETSLRIGIFAAVGTALWWNIQKTKK